MRLHNLKPHVFRKRIIMCCFQSVLSGNDAINIISSNGRHKLRVDLEVISGRKYYAEYSNFRLEDENSNYLAHVTGYSGTAGENISH